VTSRRHATTIRTADRPQARPFTADPLTSERAKQET